MATTLRRKNTGLLDFLRAVYVGAISYFGLAALGVAPRWLAAAVALLAAGLTFASFEIGAFVFLFALAVAVFAVAPVLGILFAVAALVSLRYIGTGRGGDFVIVTAAALGVLLGPGWAMVGLAGYLLGAKRGALAAALGCLAAQVIGFSLGRPFVGVLATGGATPLVDPAAMPPSLLATEWIGPTLQAIDVKAFDATYQAIASVTAASALVLQPMLWALGAIFTAWISRTLWQSGKERLAPISTAAGIAVPALASLAVGSIVGLPSDPTRIGIAFGLSAAVAILLAYAWDLLFPIEVPSVQAAVATPASMAAQDEDVDELLRLIATAEEKVATQYTSVKTVMITDMKSFSAMTEELGSVLTAKAVQLHRDLLLPVIERNGGKGKPAGGDGLIAAFDDAATAVAAAVDMQRTMAEHNRIHPRERAMTVRIGVAYGEVVLDRGGRPFIGEALNVAARIMNLADGGQAFTTATVAGRAGLDLPTHSHGQFELKNIEKPVEVIELLWHEGQVPIDPRSRQAPAPAAPPSTGSAESPEG